MSVGDLKELTEEELEVELKCAIFLDDVRQLCQTVKLPEHIIEERFMNNENLPTRILRTIFCNQPLSQQFIMKYLDLISYNWIILNPYLCENKDLLDGVKVAKKLTEDVDTN